MINTICVDGEEGFITDFKFSTKSVLVVPLCSNHTGKYYLNSKVVTSNSGELENLQNYKEMHNN